MTDSVEKKEKSFLHVFEHIECIATLVVGSSEREYLRIGKYCAIIHFNEKIKPSGNKILLNKETKYRPRCGSDEKKSIYRVKRM